MKLIRTDQIFVPYKSKVIVSKTQEESNVQLELHRKDGTVLEYSFQRSINDRAKTDFPNEKVKVALMELPDHVPCMLLVCAEHTSLFARTVPRMKHVVIHLETITEDDDLLSTYGIQKWRRCVRSNNDCVFFAGPCTGGSPWNRLNALHSEATAHAIRMKATQYWRLWLEFARCLQHVFAIGAMALLDLPNGCDYWKDERMIDLLSGTPVHDHRFDGCMYGLRSTYSKKHERLKKPWRIVSWGVEFPKLRDTCDGLRDHGKCEGRETKLTQEYTEKIIRIITNRVNREVIRRIGGSGRT